MNQIIELTESQVLTQINNTTPWESLVEEQENVALIFTQDWCPQWHNMRNYLNSLDDFNLVVYWCSYNTFKQFESVMQYKEKTWKNEEVPYVRYYHNGQYINESNFVSSFGFIDFFTLS